MTPETVTPPETVRMGRDRYLAENSLSLESYTAPDFPVRILRWTVRLPNPGFLPLHDLHHVATGFGSGLLGEAEISAYELRAGCRSALIHLLCVGAILLALFRDPARVYRAWRSAKGTRTLYHTSIPYEDLLKLSVVELRRQLGIPPAGLASKSSENV